MLNIRMLGGTVIGLVAAMKAKPFRTSVIGWVSFPSMYLLVGVFSASGISVETSFLIASPLGLFGFICWVAAFWFGMLQLLQGERNLSSLGGVILSAAPLIFLGIGLGVAFHGGV